MAQLDPAAREALAADPLAAILDLFGVHVDLTDETAAGAGCSVHGTYFPDPPRMTVVATASRRRRNFTSLHEFGHHLVRQNPELVDVLALAPGGGRAIEEAICDTFAAEVLIPRHVVDEHIPTAGPAARDVVALVDITQASRSACCAAAARRLSGEGYVVLAELDGTVRYAAQARPSFVVAPGTAQPADSPLTRAGRVGHARRDGRLRYATGTLSPSFHADVVRAAGGYVFGVFTRGKPPWGGLDILTDDGPRGRQATCVHCEADFEAFGRPCPNCGDDRCPRCGRCGCRSGPAETVCPDCGLVGNAALIAAGDCPNC